MSVAGAIDDGVENCVSYILMTWCVGDGSFVMKVGCGQGSSCGHYSLMSAKPAIPRSD
jgi:hypothetical protein